jgi:hypothetical protein
MSATHIIKKPGNQFVPERSLSKATVLCNVKQKRGAMMLQRFKALFDAGQLSRPCKRCMRLGGVKA